MSRTLSGRAVLMWLVGFFGIIIAVNIWFITASIRTFSGEDEQQPYLQGIEYNQTLARRTEQKTLGWRAVIGASRVAGGNVRVSITIRRSDGTPQPGLILRGELRHPTDEGRDRPLDPREITAGVYQADLVGIGRGEWDVMVHTNANQAPFEAMRRLWVP